MNPLLPPGAPPGDRKNIAVAGLPVLQCLRCSMIPRTSRFQAPSRPHAHGAHRRGDRAPGGDQRSQAALGAATRTWGGATTTPCDLSAPSLNIGAGSFSRDRLNIAQYFSGARGRSRKGGCL